MSEGFDLIIKGGACITPSGQQETDIGIRHGRFAALGDINSASGVETIQARGLHVLPGVIDSHVHFREPGMEHMETLAAGSRGAVLGGVTCVFDMGNSEPPVSTRETVSWKRDYVTDRIWCDMGFYIAASRENVTDLAALEIEPGVCGIKVMAGSSLIPALLIEDDATLEQIMSRGFRRVAYHAEDEYRLRERRMAVGEVAPYGAHPEVHDAEVAFRCTRRLMALAEKTGRRAHIVHVTTAAEIAYLANFRDFATVEVLPIHLTFQAPEAYERLGGLAVVQPPVRDRSHVEALWQGVRNGIVDTLGSDHAPHDREAKRRPYLGCPSGAPGVQTLVPIMLHHVNAGQLSLQRFVDLTAAGPARVFGLVGKGRIAVGYDADLTIVDIKARRTIENAQMASICGWTPFDGMMVTGWPVATIVRGNIVMRDGEVHGPPIGRPARFGESFCGARKAEGEGAKNRARH